MSGDIFACHDWGGGWYSPWGWRPEMLTNIRWCSGQCQVGKVPFALEGVVGTVCRGDWVAVWTKEAVENGRVSSD